MAFRLNVSKPMTLLSLYGAGAVGLLIETRLNWFR
jgi:hypothetical protein